MGFPSQKKTKTKKRDIKAFLISQSIFDKSESACFLVKNVSHIKFHAVPSNRCRDIFRTKNYEKQNNGRTLKPTIRI